MKKNIILSIVAIVLLAGCNDTKSNNQTQTVKQESTPVVKQEAKTVVKQEVKKISSVAKTAPKEEKKAVVETQTKEPRRANPAKGQKIFARKLKEACGMNGGQVAKKHTQDEWKAIEKAGKIKDEIKKICPKTTDDALKDKYLENYFDFFYNYASDSGNIPSC